MMANEPLSDERLAEIRRYAEAIRDQMHDIEGVSTALVWSGIYIMELLHAYHHLLADVDRLRAREAAAMAIVREVATKGVTIYSSDGKPEASIAPETVDKARALLAEE